MKYLTQISFILILLAGLSCHKPPEYSEVPRIAFERLKLTDTSTLVLTFEFRDGDGDIGLDNENVNVDDITDPYHALSVIVDDQDNIVTFSNDVEGPFDAAPAALLPTDVTIYKGQDDQGQALFETQTILVLFRAGDEVPFSDGDNRPSTFDCEDYEIISFYSIDSVFNQEGELESEILVETKDTVYVDRNPFHFNIYVDLLVKEGDDYRVFEFPECDPGYTARFPVFDRSGFGRPLDGSITYAFFSTQFATENSFLLDETLKLRFYIYDRALNQSNVVETPDFKLLDLRQGDLVAKD